VKGRADRIGFVPINQRRQDMQYVDENSLPVLGNEEFAALLATARDYTVCILHAGPQYETLGRNEQGAPSEIIFEHGKRNAALHVAGLLPVVCPIFEGGPVKGIGIFSGDLEEVQRIMAEDPGVKAGVFTVELHPCKSFPGSTLPA
jgi:hypothetical protein